MLSSPPDVTGQCATCCCCKCWWLSADLEKLTCDWGPDGKTHEPVVWFVFGPFMFSPIKPDYLSLPCVRWRKSWSVVPETCFAPRPHSFFFFELQNSGQEEGRSHDVSSGISCGRMDLVFEMPCLGTCHFLSLMCFSCLADRDGCEQ